MSEEIPKKSKSIKIPKYDPDFDKISIEGSEEEDIDKIEESDIIEELYEISSMIDNLIDRLLENKQNDE
jgi:hypothetical protein